MDFVSTRIITADVARLVAFYERVTGVEATWATEDFAELVTAHGTLAVASERTVPLFAEGSARAAANHSAVIEFLVDDVDRVHKELADVVGEFVNGPATMPWATGPCSSVTPTATWSTSSPPTPRPPSRGSPGDEAARRSRRRTPARLAPPRRGHPGVRPAVRTSPQVHGASAPHPETPRHRTFPRTGRPVAGTALVGPPRRNTPNHHHERPPGKESMMETVLSVGLDPRVVGDPAAPSEAFPEVDAAQVRAGLAQAEKELESMGLGFEICLLDRSEAAADAFRAAVTRKHYAVIVIGAGVRMEPSLTPLFEKLVNIARTHSPRSVLCFNTGPDKTVEAVRRWWPPAAEN